MRRLDPHRTPQELRPATVPTVAIFSIGTLVWLAILVVLGARHLLGYGTAAGLAAIAAAGVGLGLIGIAWGRLRNRRQPDPEQARSNPAPPGNRTTSDQSDPPTTSKDQDPT